MATIIAAAGGGNWTAGGAWVGGVAPGTGDDAQLTAASGNVTIDTGAVARSLDCTTYTGTLTHNAGVGLSLGDGTAGAGNAALKLVAGMTYTLLGAGTISFVSTSATQQTITTAGKTLGAPFFSGTGSSYLLGDSLTVGALSTVTLSAGTFNTGNFACSWGLFAITSAVAKTLTLGSSAIAITGNSNNAVLYNTSGLTVTANTAVMTFSGASQGVNLNASAFTANGLSLVFTAPTTSARIIAVGVSGLNNVTLSGPTSKTLVLTVSSGALALTGTLTVTGNSTVNRVLFSSDTVGTTRTVTVTTGFSFSNVDFQDITAAGAAGTWTGTSMGDALGNSNITFDPAATQTRSGAGGNYSTAGSWTSRVPLPQDNVVIGAGASGTITMDMPRLGADVDFTGFAGTAAFNSTANTLYGAINLASGMTVSGTQQLNLAARSAKTITSNGRTFSQTVAIIAPGGTYTLSDAFVSTAGVSLADGTLATANFPMQAFFLTAGAGTTRVWNLGTSTITLMATSLNNQLFDPGTSGAINTSATNFVIGAASANGRLFASRGASIGSLTYTVAGSTGSLTMNGGNHNFGALNFSDASNARSLLFTAATTITVSPGGWNVNGTAGKLITVDSLTAATHTLSMASGVVSSDYLSVKNSLAGGGATWYAGANSTDAGGNTGWIFTAPPSSAGNLGGGMGRSGIRLYGPGAQSIVMHARR